MRVNKQIRALKLRVIDKEGKQIGLLSLQQALALAEEEGLDLVEISPNAVPPVCKIIDYGKFRYQQTKKERESKKAQHQIKVKEVKCKPNIDSHDLQVKIRHAREFLEKGNKVKITCTFKGREMMHPEVGRKVIEQFVEGLALVASVDEMPKQMGRMLSVTFSPGVKGQPKVAGKKGHSSSEGTLGSHMEDVSVNEQAGD